MRYTAMIGCFILAGCQNLGPAFEADGGLGINAQKMQADQIKATVDLIKANKEKDQSARCVRVPTPYGVAIIIEVNSDTAGKMRGKMQMLPDCTVTVENDSMPLPTGSTTPIAKPTP